MIKRSIQEEDMTIVNIYAPNIGVSQYIKQTPKNKKPKMNPRQKTVTKSGK